MLTGRELKNIWREAGFRPSKRLGQNFLTDANVLKKILATVQISPGDTVVEIGPGFGEITGALARRAKKVIALEKDRRIIEILKNRLKLPPNAEVIRQDFLDFNFSETEPEEKIVVYGNLPYYATSPIIEKILKNINRIKKVYFVVQKEVASRILAGPGSRETGRLTVFVRYYTEPRFLFHINRRSFYPVPEVESSFVELTVPEKRRVRVADEAKFFGIVKAAFAQRRKTLLNSLSGLVSDKKVLSELLTKAGISPKSRAEELSVGDFARLTCVFAQNRL